MKLNVILMKILIIFLLVSIVTIPQVRAISDDVVSDVKNFMSARTK